MLRLPALLLLLVLVAPVAAQQVIYVDADAVPGGDGASWATAFDDLQDALATAQAGDAVWVAEGTYRPGDGTPQTGGRDVSFHLVDGVALYGGFDGTEASLEERDPEQHPTVLSGDLDADGTYAGNAYHVVTASGSGPSTLLDGFTITAGSADGLNPRNRGGGLYGVGTSLVVRQCIITRNRAVQTDGDGGGAGAFVGGAGSSPRFERVAFLENDGGGAIGGGLWALDGERVTLVDAAFEGNRAAYGGGARITRNSVDALRVRFVRNGAREADGGLGVSSADDAVIVSAVFHGNTVDPFTGGGDLSINGGLYVGGSTLLLANATFVGNAAGFAGGMGIAGSNATLVNVAFSHNEATAAVPPGQGGALRAVSGSTVRLRNAVLWGNTAPAGPEVYIAGADVYVDQALIQGGCPPPGTGTAVCEGLLDADPLFTRTPSPGPDGAWGTTDDDYGDLRLQATSPALDHGLAALLPPDLLDLDGDGDTAEPLPLDLDGGARVQGAEVDLGPYERPVQTLVVEAAPVGGPIVVPPEGGRFAFRVRLTNTGDEAVVVSGGTAVYLPGGTLHGPLLVRSGVVVPAGSSVVGTFRQRVPPQAPSGAYEYVVYTGSYPSFAQTALFPFTKEAYTAAREETAGTAGWEVEVEEPFAVEGLAARAAAVAVGDVLSVGAAYPNPARGHATLALTLREAGGVEVSVYDALGRRVVEAPGVTLEAGAHALPLDVSALPSGVYLVRVVAHGEAAVQRLVVAR